MHKIKEQSDYSMKGKKGNENNYLKVILLKISMTLLHEKKQTGNSMYSLTSFKK